MLWTIIHIIDILLWIFIAGSVIYVLFFAVASLFPQKTIVAPNEEKRHSFLVLYPAYKEDSVIITSIQKFLRQDYPTDHYHLVVISDQMKEETNTHLHQFPITVLQPSFEKSSKAKALQYAIAQTKEDFDYVVILDADNVVNANFLCQLNSSCNRGHQAIQCHRCAKNADNDIAILDGVSEEINNTLFRRAHNIVGLSSALIGSGMCFNYKWFAANVEKLNSAVEDRELEALLMKQNIYIKFEEGIPVYDEKVSNRDNFQRQRLRWMTGQIQSLLNMLPYIPKAFVTGNINYIDKTVQQALIPRSILIVSILTFALLMTLISRVWAAKWWCLFIILSISLFIAIPPQLRTRSIFGKILQLPALVWRMLSNLIHIDKNNKEFIHTEHQTN
ncbi:MAG: glycosyltransferase family 2 protein [Prevotella sp.]|nr:glycosyltransferase family 2 protein [Prevotella sp.]